MRPTVQDSSESSSRSSPSSSQRGRTPRWRFSSTSRRPSLSVGARQSCSRGPATRTLRPPVDSSLRMPVSRSTAARVPPASSTPSRVGRVARRAVRRGFVDGRLELLPGDLVPRRRPLGRLAQEEPERDRPLALAAPGQPGRDVERLAGPDAQRGQVAARSPLAVDGQLPLAAVAVEAGEEVPVVDAEAAASERLDADRLREELELVQRGVGGAVGPDDPVGAEVRVVPNLAEVAAVRPVLAPAAIDLADAVVDPLPDEAALQRGVAVERRVVVGEAAVRVAHRVRVLAHDDRARIVVAQRVGLDRGELRVHRADDVGGRAAARPVAPDRALVVQRPRRIALAHPAGGGVVIRRRSRSRCRATRGSRSGGSCRARPCSGRARRTRPCSAGRCRARRRRRATRRSPRRPRRGRSGRRGRASTGRSGSATSAPRSR